MGESLKPSNIADRVRKAINRLSFTQTLVLGYMGLVLVSAVILTFPFCSRAGEYTPIGECIFMTTSALSGTGLVLYDTYSHWSFIGQIVILIVIQIGGIGFMSMTVFALSFTSKKIGLRQRVTMRESVAGINGGGAVKSARFILKGTILVESVGAAVLCLHYIPRCGVGRGIFFAVFHSVSAFCTAGIDLMGYFEPGSSLCTVYDDVLLNLTLIILLNIGGIGFIAWDDIVHHKWHLKKYKLQSKIVLVITLIFYIAAALLTLLLEWNDGLGFAEGVGDKVLVTSMLVTSGRDAGFAPLAISTLKPATIMILLVLMFVGGAPGSTACGIKTTTFAVMILTIVSVFRKRKNVECFGRRIDDATVRNSCCVITLYLAVVTLSAIAICGFDDQQLTPVVFEIVSAISSCGLSMGITAELSHISHTLLTIIMFFGRIGGITFIISLTHGNTKTSAQLPEEKIMVG